MKTSDLTGPALDWAVAKCEGWRVPALKSQFLKRDKYYNPSISYLTWAQGGPIIEKGRIQVTPRGKETDVWEAIIFDRIFQEDGTDCFQVGPTPLSAAMRCYVASKMGDEVEIPEELK